MLRGESPRGSDRDAARAFAQKYGFIPMTQPRAPAGVVFFITTWLPR